MTTNPKKPGRPKRDAPAGRDLAAEQAHLVAWWAVRPGGKPSSHEVARRLEISQPQAHRLLNGKRDASVNDLENMQRMLGAYGYECPTNYHLFL